MTAIDLSISSDVVVKPILNLTDDSASLKDLPSEGSTWETVPLLHAELLEHTI